jgi:hypothetical protein
MKRHCRYASVIMLLCPGCAYHLADNYDIKRLDGPAEVEISSDQRRIYVDYFEHYGMIYNSAKKDFESKHSTTGEWHLYYLSDKNESGYGTSFNPCFLIQSLRESGIDISGIVVGKNQPFSDHTHQFCSAYIYNYELNPNDLILHGSMHMAQQSPWWTKIQWLDLMVHALIFPTIKVNYLAQVEFELLNKKRERLHHWVVMLELKYIGPLTRALGEEEVTKLACKKIENDIKNIISSNKQ